jgi:uncharacterized membrane protein
MIKLVGILLIALGFGFRVNALAVILVAGVVTGMSAGFSLREVVEMTGKFFVENRGMTLPIIMMLPVVGLLEKHGLQERVAMMLRKLKSATAGKIYLVYQVIRGAFSVVGISMGNHAGMVRPLIVPMAESAAKERGELSEQTREKIRGHGAASENIGNFFSDDILVAVGALLLVKGVLDTAGVPVSLEKIKLWGVPTALWVILVGWLRYRALDRWLKRKKGGDQ